MYLIDEEGSLETRDVNARFIHGKPEIIESIYIMKIQKLGIGLYGLWKDMEKQMG
jgi:photosystem II reaction center protein Psb28